MSLAWDAKDPGETLDYDIYWLPRLAADTITASSWAITVGDGALSIVSSSFTTTRAKVILSGGTLGTTYTLTNTVTTAIGDIAIENVQLKIAAK